MIPSKLNENRAAIIDGLRKTYSEIVDYCESLDAFAFSSSPDHRWSASEQLEHLILSSKGVASALKMPKEQLALMGKSENGSISYEDLFAKYKGALTSGIKASPPFSPDPNKDWSKDELLGNWKMIGRKLEERILFWNEEELDSYQMPHPAIGKITVREMLFFTEFHAQHHLKSMKALFETV